MARLRRKTILVMRLVLVNTKTKRRTFATTRQSLSSIAFHVKQHKIAQKTRKTIGAKNAKSTRRLSVFQLNAAGKFSIKCLEIKILNNKLIYSYRGRGNFYNRNINNYRGYRPQNNGYQHNRNRSYNTRPQSTGIPIKSVPVNPSGDYNSPADIQSPQQPLKTQPESIVDSPQPAVVAAGMFFFCLVIVEAIGG